MKLLKILMFVSLLNAILFSYKAVAEGGIGSFNFNQDIGGVLIKNVTVQQNSNFAQVTVFYVIPRCPNQYHPEGSIKIFYSNGKARITRTLPITAQIEGVNAHYPWFVAGYYGNPTQGNVNVSAEVHCVYHGVNNRGEPKWAPWNW
jgi:hypothetical protein